MTTSDLIGKSVSHGTEFWALIYRPNLSLAPVEVNHTEVADDTECTVDVSSALKEGEKE